MGVANKLNAEAVRMIFLSLLIIVCLSFPYLVYSIAKRLCSSRSWLLLEHLTYNKVYQYLRDCGYDNAD